MTSRRAAIAMSGDELAGFITGERIVTCATNGVRGWPHVMPLWFVVRGQDLWAWTFAKSQKARNLQRDPRATLQIEAGDSYDQLRGAMLEARATIHRELETVTGLGIELLTRYAPDGADPETLRPVVAAQAPKRVALQFTPVRIASFDHRKLA